MDSGGPSSARLTPPRGVLETLRAAVAEARFAGSRANRVVLLLWAILLMSLGDLALTLTFATSTGMVETNPIARAVMSHGSTAAIIIWKLATVAVCIIILYIFRARRASELAAWICFFVLTALSFHWMGYANRVALLAADQGTIIVSHDPRFVHLGK